MYRKLILLVCLSVDELLQYRDADWFKIWVSDGQGDACLFSSTDSEEDGASDADAMSCDENSGQDGNISGNSDPMWWTRFF